MHYQLVYWVEIDGYPMPKRYGGHPALDFCNTWAGWDVAARSTGGVRDPRREWLPTYDRFAVWARHVDLLPVEVVARLRQAADAAPRAAQAVLRRAHHLRELLYALLLAPADGEAFAGFARIAQSAQRASELRIDPAGQVRRVLPEDLGLVLPLYAVARAAEELLADPTRPTVRACPGQDCGWLFLDPRGRRRWCDMANCGNRAKVRAHAARHSR